MGIVEIIFATKWLICNNYDIIILKSMKSKRAVADYFPYFSRVKQYFDLSEGLVIKNR